MNIFSLPPETLVAILSLLNVRDILSFCRTCRLAHEIFLNSSALQYTITLSTTGMVDTGAYSPIGTRERLEYLTRREDMWMSLRLQVERRIMIPVERRHSHIHDLTAGFYIFGELNVAPESIRTNILSYANLPSCFHDVERSRSVNPQGFNWWKRISLNVEALTIGLSLEYNDLLVVVTSVPLANAGDGDAHVFQLHLKEFSTGKYHPLAHLPIIQFHEHRTEGNQCIASIDVAERYLLVLLTWLRAPSTPDELFLYDWMSGDLILHISSGSFTYRGAAFLSLDTFILTNMQENVLEFLRLRNRANEPAQCRWIGKLALPTLRCGSSLISMNCRTDAVRSRRFRSTVPKPDAQSTSGPSGTSKRIMTPVHCTPDKAIIQFRMYLQGGGRAPNVGHVSLFAFIAHRGELLQVVETDAPEQGLTSPTEVTAKPWEEWGPHLTRWSGTDETDTAWMAGVAGQRQIFITGNRPRRIHVRDFNAATIRKEQLRATSETPDSRIKVVSEETVTVHQGCFANNVRSSLPFVEITSEQAFGYDGVLMDESHVIGLTEDEEDASIRQLDVFIMSPDVPQICNCADVSVGDTDIM